VLMGRKTFNSKSGGNTKTIVRIIKLELHFARGRISRQQTGRGGGGGGGKDTCHS